MIIYNIKRYEELVEYMNKYTYLIINISAIWCKPCLKIKPLIENYIKVIDENEYCYIKIDYFTYELDNRFDKMFNMTKIPYFCIIKNKNIVNKIITSDFMQISKYIYDYIKTEKLDHM